jgi:protein-glutamine gamma-glutamyltransferase
MAFWSALLSRSSQTPIYTRPSLTLFFLLAGSFLLALVPHVVQFPIWLTIGILAAIALRAVIEYYRLPLPSTTFCGIMAIILLGFILIQFQGNVLGRDPGTAFTAGLLAIKFYELRRPRDVALIIFSCFFVVMSALLYSQVLELFVYCLIMMWILTSLLLRVHTGDLPQDNLLRMLGQSGFIFLQALPLAGVLFFCAPRVQGPLGLPFEEGKLGLSESVAPGSIAKLALDDSPAMSVVFPAGSNIPLTNFMYWRALVLWRYEHGVWNKGDMASLPDGNMVIRDKTGPEEVEQTITVFAHYQRWLFALDQPVSLPFNEAAGSRSWARALAGHVVQLNDVASPSSTQLDHMARYDVISSERRPEENLQEAAFKQGTLLPTGGNDSIDPQVIALADKLHQGLTDSQEEEYIAKVISYFRQNNFVYTMEPGSQEQGSDWLKYFLFTNKKGFCEHYASAFAVLLRLKNIPTRLVVGYLGADYNPYSDTYTVSQSNAHAWDEVFIRDKNQPSGVMRGRWMRYDPTALITATENELSTASSVSGQDNIRVIHYAPNFAEKYLPAWVRDQLKEFGLRREEVETSWDNIVLSYDTETQDRLAQALGLGEGARFNLLLACLAAAAICIIVFQRWMGRRPAIPPVEILYTNFCRSMARRGIPRATWEGPLAYTERVAEAFPDDRQSIERVGSIVANVRYGREPVDPNAPHQLKSILTVLTASQAATAFREKK